MEYFQNAEQYGKKDTNIGNEILWKKVVLAYF